MNNILTLPKAAIGFFLLLATGLRAQQEIPQSRWQVGINLQPSIGYRIHTGNKDVEYFRNNDFIPAYDLGINVNFFISKHIDIEAGVHYGRFGYKTLSKYYTHSPNVPLQLEETLFWNYISLPLRMNFHSTWNKINLIGGIGLAPGYMVSKGGEGIATYYNGTQQTRTYANVSKNDNRFNLFPVANFGVEYRFTQRMAMRAELSSQAGLLKLKQGKSSILNLYLWNTGLNIGCYFRIP